MKNFLPALVSLLLLSCIPSFAQDTLVWRSGLTIPARVLKITPTDVEYKRADNPDGPLIVVRRADLAGIHYANGTREEFTGVRSIGDSTNTAGSGLVVSNPIYSSSVTSPLSLSHGELYLKGRQDALLYYKGHGPMWGTFGAFVAYPLAGLGTGLIFSVTRMNQNNIIPSDPRYLQEPTYIQGYQKQAQKRRVGKAAAGVGMGLGLYTLIVLIFVAAAR